MRADGVTGRGGAQAKAMVLEECPVPRCALHRMRESAGTMDILLSPGGKVLGRASPCHRLLEV